MMPVDLKLCTTTDVAALSAVASQSYREHYLYLWTAERYVLWYLQKSFSPQSLHQQINNSGSFFYFIYHQGQQAGFLKINLHKAADGTPQKHSLELERIYLLHAVSGKGVGTAVIKWLIARAEENGIKKLWLKSMDSSPSIRFYQKNGFQKTGEERLSFEGFKDEYRRMWVMQKIIA